MSANGARFSPDWSTPPGRSISRIMTKLGLSIDELALEVDLSHTAVHSLLKGDIEISQSIADRLSDVLGSSSSFWINRERQYREDLRRLDPSKYELKALDENWAKLFPLRDMRKFGWIAASTDRDNYAHALRSFFNVSTVQAWNDNYRPAAAVAAFRTSPTFESNPAAVTAWLRWAEIVGNQISCSPWNRDALIKTLPQMRKLTRRKTPSLFIPALTSLCALCGIALVIAPAPTGCRASGATKFLNKDKALIVLSLRYKSDDHFWFTFFHEVGHLILHSQEALFLEDNSDIDSAEEQEANLFAQRTLIPDPFQTTLETVKVRTQSILRLSVQIGVSPGIVVGQLQHSGLIGRGQMNHLKRRYNWEDFN